MNTRFLRAASHAAVATLIVLAWPKPALAGDLLMDAIKSGNIERVREVFKRDDDSNEFSELGVKFDTAPILQAAVRTGRKEIVELLLKHGYNVRQQDENGDTALHVAAMMGRADIEELLIAHGADVNARDKRGETPLTKIIRAYPAASVLDNHGGTR